MNLQKAVMGGKTKTTRKASDKQEKRLEKKYGFKRVPNSGNALGYSGDNEDSNWKLDGKATSKWETRVKESDVDKIEREAVAHGKLPGLVICLGNSKYYEYVVLTEDGMKEVNFEDEEVCESCGKSFLIDREIEKVLDKVEILKWRFESGRIVGMMRMKDFDLIK